MIFQTVYIDGQNVNILTTHFIDLSIWYFLVQSCFYRAITLYAHPFINYDAFRAIYEVSDLCPPDYELYTIPYQYRATSNVVISLWKINMLVAPGKSANKNLTLYVYRPNTRWSNVNDHQDNNQVNNSVRSYQRRKCTSVRRLVKQPVVAL